jgi:hypothetical protein
MAGLGSRTSLALRYGVCVARLVTATALADLHR